MINRETPICSEFQEHINRLLCKPVAEQGCPLAGDTPHPLMLCPKLQYIQETHRHFTCFTPQPPQNSAILTTTTTSTAQPRNLANGDPHASHSPPTPDHKLRGTGHSLHASQYQNVARKWTRNWKMSTQNLCAHTPPTLRLLRRTPTPILLLHINNCHSPFTQHQHAIGSAQHALS